MLFSSLAVIPIELLHPPAPVCAFLALFSPAGFAMAINEVVRAEGRGRGVNMQNFWSRVVSSTFLRYSMFDLIFLESASSCVTDT